MSHFSWLYVTLSFIVTLRDKLSQVVIHHDTPSPIILFPVQISPICVSVSCAGVHAYISVCGHCLLRTYVNEKLWSRSIPPPLPPRGNVVVCHGWLLMCVVCCFSFTADESSGKLEPKITYRFPREEEHFVSHVTLLLKSHDVIWPVPFCHHIACTQLAKQDEVLADIPQFCFPDIEHLRNVKKRYDMQ